MLRIISKRKTTIIYSLGEVQNIIIYILKKKVSEVIFVRKGLQIFTHPSFKTILTHYNHIIQVLKEIRITLTHINYIIK
jgi:hypothetical protein